MSFLPDWWRREPVRFWRAPVVFVNSLVTLAVVLEFVALDATRVSESYLAWLLESCSRPD